MQIPGKHIFLLLLGLTLLSGCGPRKASESESDSLVGDSTSGYPKPVADVIDAVRSGNSRKFASLVSYPLARPYPLRDIRNQAEMTKYYSRLMDDSLKNRIIKSKPQDWTEEGWRGWTLDDGQYIWIDNQLYDVNYVSSGEQYERDSLVRDELASLPPELAKGWKPAFCLRSIDSGAIFRVDSCTVADSTRYRLAVYPKNSDLSGHPSQILLGRLEKEGSAGTETYLFSDKDGNEATYQGDLTDDNSFLQIVLKAPKKHEVPTRVEKAYWRDWLKGSPGSRKGARRQPVNYVGNSADSSRNGASAASSKTGAPVDSGRRSR